MAIEIVDLPIENGGSFHSSLYVYQAGYSERAWNESGNRREAELAEPFQYS